MINVLLVEDHELYRMGLSMLLSKAEDINLVAEAGDGIEGVRKAKELTPDVILMDIGLPNMDGIEATLKIKEFLPEVKILIFTSRDSEHDIFESFKAGADGYIMKGASPEQTISAIKAVFEGVGWIDPAIAKVVFSNIGVNKTKVESLTEPNNRKDKNIYGLTERELDVLSLMVDGLTNPQIAEKLVITRATAKAHVHSILQKLCATSRTQATVMAMKEGLV
ncbi:MAG: response regulator transcription factor [Cyanobacteria bacterium SIG31]|nr:response regulator transcription factor [Cyanobacteria bacterium SIG31]